jgi:FAD/FMN-containing dehydrogenase
VLQSDSLADVLDGRPVLDDPETLDEYARDESLAPPTKPRGVVWPGTPEEVQQLVRWAAATSTPLVPVSSGPPHFRGDSVPSEGGAVVVDLRSMNRILRIDRRNRVAMIEPGVTYAELVPALREEGLAPYLPLVPRRTKSVVASMLEREPITAPRHHWDSQDPLLCLEVIFGNGELFRTGSAAGPGTLEEQRRAGGAQMRGMGPGQTDLQRIVQGAQGTMGIVTWATIKCRLLPRLRESSFAASEELAPLVELAQELLRTLIGDELLILNGQALAGLLADGADAALRLRRELPPWVLYVGVDGTGLFPEERIGYQVAAWRELAQRLGLHPVRRLPGGVEAAAVERLLSAPSPDPYWKLRLRGACEDVLFLAPLGRAPDLVRLFAEHAARVGFPLADVGAYVQPVVQGTSCHCELHLPYDRSDPAQVRAVRRLVLEAGRPLMDAGAFFSRPYGPWADLAYGRDAATTAALRKLKAIFDPANVMNPGKLCF